MFSNQPERMPGFLGCFMTCKRSMILFLLQQNKEWHSLMDLEIHYRNQKCSY
jgi:hypothetical protein